MPDRGKKYYRIGEVSKLTGVEPHVLRYWEGEFRQIRPHRVARQRLYRIEDVQLIRRIKGLLYDQGFTIAGARRRLWEERRSGEGETPRQDSRPGYSEAANDLIGEIRQELSAIREMLGPCRRPTITGPEGSDPSEPESTK